MLGRLKFDITPLVDEILDRLPSDVWSNPTTTFLDPALGGGQFVRAIENRLRIAGHSNENISKRVYGFESNRMRINFAVNKYKLVGNYSNADFLDGEVNMKFDVVVGNPPYTQGTKYLYRYFFEKSLEISDKVAMVMPYQPNSNYDSLKKLNKLIATHQEYISDNVSHHFNVDLDNIHYIIADKNVVNEVQEYIDPLTTYQPIFANRKRLNPIKGNTAVSDNTTTDENGISIIDKVLQTGPVERKVKEQIVKNAPQRIKTNFAVFTNHTPSQGKFNVCIKENFNSTWSMSVFAYEVDSKDEAEKLADWLKSDIIREEVNKMFALKNTYAVTLEMLRKLPWYE